MHSLPTLVAIPFLACSPKAPEAPSAPALAPEEEAARFAAEVDGRLLELYRGAESAQWMLQTDITDEHETAASAADEQVMAYLSEVIPRSARYSGLANLDPSVARQLRLLRVAGTLPAPKDPTKRGELATLANGLGSAYGKGQWCKTPSECLKISEIEERLAKSRDPAEQLALWEGWSAIGAPMRADYARLVQLTNEGAAEIGFANTGEAWRSAYDMAPPELEAEVGRLWTQVAPLYSALHCNTRAKLSAKYGAKVVSPSGPIPAHLLGNLWAQDWSNVYDLVEPYKKQPSIDVTKALADQKWDAQRMTRAAEGFFVSLGLDPLPSTFWERSMFAKPADKDVVCHPSAWDPTWSDDLRLKMCVEPTQEDLVTLHHELGHLSYYHAYQGLPTLFRQGANDGFHEAIGDTIALSITPEYLRQIGLLAEVAQTPEAVVNAQMQVALKRIAFLPFGLLIDRWRWEVFDGRIAPDAYNAGWWRLRREIQGVAPVSARGEDQFDPGAKYHVPANVPYLRYFLAHVLEFQLHRALCREAGWTGPLHACSVYGNAAAGAKLKLLLSLGASRPWPEALEAATGEQQLDASAIVEYFQPLTGYLDTQNRGRTCGW